MGKQYIPKIHQGLTKDFCVDLKQKETELLLGYRAKIDSRNPKQNRFNRRRMFPERSNCSK